MLHPGCKQARSRGRPRPRLLGMAGIVDNSVEDGSFDFAATTPQPVANLAAETNSSASQQTMRPSRHTDYALGLSLNSTHHADSVVPACARK